MRLETQIHSSNGKNRIVIIDGLNLFFRNFIVNPSLGTNGEPIGGLRGFILSIQKYCRMFEPSAVFVVWDGHGGSKKKRSIVKTYKEGRKPIKLNNSVEMGEDEQDANRIWQQVRIHDYLNLSPIPQLMLEAVEADDIIAYLAHDFEDCIKVIVSSDRDFLQLCDNTTTVYRPSQDALYTGPRVINEYGIHPRNLALARALAGDKSDNLPGVRGIGIKTVAKRFPYLRESTDYHLDHILDTCEKSNLKTLKRVIDNTTLVKNNYKIMQLYAPNLVPYQKRKIEDSLTGFPFEFEDTHFRAAMAKDGMSDNLGKFFDRMKQFSKNSIEA